MKKKTGVLVSLISMMVMLISGLCASAQIQFVFKMSQSFYAGNARMPPGTYTLRQLMDAPGVYVLENDAGSHSVTLETRSSSKTSKGNPEVLFNRYGTTDYLEGVATSNGSSIDVLPGVAEKLAAKKATPQPHTVPTA